MTSREIRQKYLDYFKARRHAIIPSASLLPDNDSTTLFIGSGMQPLIPYLLGQKHPQGCRLANSQKSFRTEDIDEVGDNRHNTFFEMLGNWSLGDYFKKEQLYWFFKFLTDELGIDFGRLYVSVYKGNEAIGVPKDTVSAEIWKNIFERAGLKSGISDSAESGSMNGEDRIFYYGDKKNWWSRTGEPADMPVGEPGGPDSEVFYDLGADLKRHENSPWKDAPCHINCECGRFIEIGNSVFMEYIKTENGFAKLPQTNVDFGGGLERITMAVQAKDNIYETDLFINLIDEIIRLSGKQYRENMKAFEVIADHLKAATFIIGDDKSVYPSNTGSGYIVRRLIRRAVRFGRILGISDKSWTAKVADIVIADYHDIYDELSRNKERIISELSAEEEKFNQTIDDGIKAFRKLLSFKIQEGTIKTNTLEAETFDIPDITGKDLFAIFSTYGFPLEMCLEELNSLIYQVHKECDTSGLFFDKALKPFFSRLTNEFNEEFKKHQELSRTASAGMFKGGLADASDTVIKLHTTAHLMLAALRKVLGGHVVQKGSNITVERLRFDFSHPDKMNDDQKAAVENIVNEAITKDLPVACEEMELGRAKEMGAMGVFEEKYGEKVKVYTIGQGENIFSREICGGPHVERTGVLGKFKIQKEESSSAGVRRIKAILE